MRVAVLFVLMLLFCLPQCAMADMDHPYVESETSNGIDPEQVVSITIELRDGRTATIQMPPEMWAEYSVLRLFGMVELGETGESVSVILD